MYKDQFIVYTTDVQDVIQFGGQSVLSQAKERVILEVEINLQVYTWLGISSVIPMFWEQQMCFTDMITRRTYVVFRSWVELMRNTEKIK